VDAGSKRKRAPRISAPVPQVSPSIAYASELSREPERVRKDGVHNPSVRTQGLVREGAGSSFKTALELARSFPIGVLPSRVCPYCYNTGYSSPGTRCSYCRREGDASGGRL
jgi:hypothetical protein